jgi:hypothetical protein
MKPHDLPHGLCSINPIEALLGGLGLGALTGSAGATASAAPTPAAPPAPAAAAPPASTPMGQAKKPAAPQPSFIGAAATQNTQSGQKTLLGQ